MTDHSDPIATTANAAMLPAPPPAELASSELRIPLLLDAAALERAASGDGLVELFGQDRALDAIRLAIGIDAPGYNVFVSGLRTRQERESVLRLLTEKAAAMPTPGDWVYVNNFRNPESPVAIYLLPGQGVELRERMSELLSFVSSNCRRRSGVRTSIRSAPVCATNITSARKSCSATWRLALASGALRSRARRKAR